MIDGLADFVESHRRALVVVVLSFALAGVLFLFQIPIAIFPQTDFPRVVVTIENGIAPVDVQMVQVTRPMEESIRLVPGITDFRSLTSRGSTEINIFFRWDVDIRDALNQVQGRISQTLQALPPNVTFRINRVTFSSFPMLAFSITSPRRSLTDLYDLAYYEIAPRLYRLDGVAETLIVGGRPREYHVVVDPQKLSAYALPLSRVADAIRNSNVLVAAGMLQENYHLYLTAVNDLVQTRGQIEDIVIESVGGTPVLLKNIASVVPGERPTYNIVTANGRPAVLVNVNQQPDGNAVAIAAKVNDELTEVRKSLPPDIEVKTYYDQSILVRQSIGSVRDSIIIGLVLSVLVLLLFLRNWRATLVAALVIPLAALIAMVFMRWFGMSFNLMTLGGIAACIGVVIDDAIVMVENITLHLSLGQSPREASRSAIVELTPALIGSTLTPIVVFAPLVFLGGVTAVFFRALALTLVTALAASLFLAIFFTPVLAALILPSSARTGSTPAKDLRDAKKANETRWLSRFTERYERVLAWSLDHPRAILAASTLIVLASVAIYLNLGTSFLPEMDEGAFVLDYVGPAGTSLKEMDRLLQHVEVLIQQLPELESYSRRTGAQLGLDIAEPNTGDFLVRLKANRRRSSEEIISGLRSAIRRSEPSLDIEFSSILNDLVGDLQSTPEPVEIKIFHPDDATFRAIAEKITDWLPKVRGATDINNRTVVIGPTINIRVDQQKAQRAGFTVTDVATIEAGILDGDLASLMIRNGRSIGIRVRYPAEYRGSIEQIQNLLLTSTTGVQVPLGNIAEVNVIQGQTEIERDNLRDMTRVTARIENRDLGSTVDEIQRRIFKEVPMPPGTEIEFGGLYRAQRESFRGLIQVALLSVLLIFVILVFEFRSFSHPLAILAATVLCTSGALFALLVTGTTLNVVSFMGAIMVVGIVHKNGILMLDAEEYFTSRGLKLRDAVFESGRRRLRPILMTALATISGMLPLALGIGAGAQLLQPLAIAVIGGVAVSMALSLLITPVLFMKLKERGL